MTALPRVRSLLTRLLCRLAGFRCPHCGTWALDLTDHYNHEHAEEPLP